MRQKLELEKHITDMKNIKEIIKQEYNANKRALLSGKEKVDECIKEDKEYGFDKSYFSTKIAFDKNTKEIKQQAIESACIRMLAFKKFLKEELGYNDNAVEIDVIEFDNYTTYVRATIQHEL